MDNLVRHLGSILQSLIEDNWNVSIPGDALVETARDLAHGDIAVTVAMRLARPLRRSPKDIAAELTEMLRNAISDEPHLSSVIESITPVGGFINIRLTDDYWQRLANRIIEDGYDFGRCALKKGSAQVEFVSANPTGPLTVAHGRQAAIGDTLARLLDFAGYDTEREYYLNDTGNQIRILGLSVYLRWRELQSETVDFPDDCYQGEYITEIAERAGKTIEVPDDTEDEAVAAFGRYACGEILSWIKEDLEGFRVHFDGFYSQEEMEDIGAVQHLVETYEATDLIYKKDAAVWLKTSQFGDRDDKVIVKADGSYTYRTPDIAYHRDKFARGFNKMAVLLGPDHHAHTITMKAGLDALNLDTGKLHYLLVQHCTLYKGGEPLKMSTRKGTFVTLREIIDAVGIDSARFFFLNRSIESHLNFDLELAKKQSADNPVFYLQYAAARCAAILRKAVEGDYIKPEELSGSYRFHPSGEWGSGIEGDEITLLRHIGRFPIVVERAAETLDPMKLINFLMSSVEAFHHYYQHRRVMVDDKSASRDRLLVVSAFRTFLENGLNLLGVTAPEKM